MDRVRDGHLLTLGELVELYLAHCDTYYRDEDGKPSGEATTMDCSLKFWLTHKAGADLPIAHFSKIEVRGLQRAMIDDGKTRVYINSTISRIRRMFVWAVQTDLIEDRADDMLASKVLGVFAAVPKLKHGRSGAIDNKPVQPVSLSDLTTTMKYLRPLPRDLCELILRTGSRVTEILRLRMCDIVKTEAGWHASPRKHKNAWRGQVRMISLDDRAMKIVRKYEKKTTLFGTDVDGERFLFLHREDRPYTRNGFRSVLRAAILRANRDGHTVPLWKPHQVRHTVAAIVRELAGLDEAQAVLGHKSRRMTEHYTGPVSSKVARRGVKALSAAVKEVL